MDFVCRGGALFKVRALQPARSMPSSIDMNLLDISWFCEATANPERTGGQDYT
jgi:hypothetical protein